MLGKRLVDTPNLCMVAMACITLEARGCCLCSQNIWFVQLPFASHGLNSVYPCWFSNCTHWLQGSPLFTCTPPYYYFLVEPGNGLVTLATKCHICALRQRSLGLYHILTLSMVYVWCAILNYHSRDGEGCNFRIDIIPRKIESCAYLPNQWTNSVQTENLFRPLLHETR
jgi:hypothetical protein